MHQETGDHMGVRRTIATVALGAMLGAGGTLGYQHFTGPDRALRNDPVPGSLDAALYEPHDSVPWYVTQRVGEDGRALVLVQNGNRADEWTLPAELPSILAARAGIGRYVVDGTVAGINTGRTAVEYSQSRFKQLYRKVKSFFTPEHAAPAAPAK